MPPSPGAGQGRGLGMDWARILAYVTGTVDQELLARNEYLAIENRICMAQLNGRLKLSDAEAQIAPAPGSAAPRTATQRALDPRTFPSANYWSCPLNWCQRLSENRAHFLEERNVQDAKERIYEGADCVRASPCAVGP